MITDSCRNLNTKGKAISLRGKKQTPLKLEDQKMDSWLQSINSNIIL